MENTWLECQGITLERDGRCIFSDVNLHVEGNGCNALVALPGQGNPSLLQLLAGLAGPTTGHIRVNGKDVTHWNRKSAAQAGISLLGPQLNLVEGLSVVENLFLGEEPSTLGFVNRKKMQRVGEELLQGLDPTLSLPWKAPLKELNLRQKLLVATSRALLSAPRLLLVDNLEVLQNAQLHPFFLQLVARIRQRGVGLFLSASQLGLVRRCLESDPGKAGSWWWLLEKQLQGPYPPEELAAQPFCARAATEIVARAVEPPAFTYPELPPENTGPCWQLQPVPHQSTSPPWEVPPGNVLGVTGFLGEGPLALWNMLVHPRKKGNHILFRAEQPIHLKRERGQWFRHLPDPSVPPPSLALLEITPQKKEVLSGKFLVTRIQDLPTMLQELSQFQGAGFSAGKWFAQRTRLLVVFEPWFQQQTWQILAPSLEEFLGEGGSVLWISPHWYSLHFFARQIVVLRSGTVSGCFSAQPGDLEMLFRHTFDFHSPDSHCPNP
ncbi:MAG TPA: ATP-binding cassette domain-containing protein [Thermotogota bacterium]|nr:ATP-binding cassette domain-containing protein [Thermotogota bacterium]HRW92550.1 ATP-binding cassette domain-containing protein [Thermotogota bacterium]